MSAEVKPRSYLSGYRGKRSQGYQPLELLLQSESESEYHITDKVDVWSFGCVLCFIATGKAPFVSDWEALAYLRHHEKLEIDTIGGNSLEQGELKETIQQMLSIDPSLRPTASYLSRIFDRLNHTGF